MVSSLICDCWLIPIMVNDTHTRRRRRMPSIEMLSLLLEALTSDGIPLHVLVSY